MLGDYLTLIRCWILELRQELANLPDTVLIRRPGCHTAEPLSETGQSSRAALRQQLEKIHRSARRRNGVALCETQASSGMGFVFTAGVVAGKLQPSIAIRKTVQESNQIPWLRRKSSLVEGTLRAKPQYSTSSALSSPDE